MPDGVIPDPNQETPETLASDLRLLVDQQRKHLDDMEQAMDFDAPTTDNLIVAGVTLASAYIEMDEWVTRMTKALKRGVI